MSDCDTFPGDEEANERRAFDIKGYSRALEVAPKQTVSFRLQLVLLFGMIVIILSKF